MDTVFKYKHVWSMYTHGQDKIKFTKKLIYFSNYFSSDHIDIPYSGNRYLIKV